MLSRSGITSRPDFEVHVLSLSLKWAVKTIGPTDSCMEEASVWKCRSESSALALLARSLWEDYT